MVSSSRGLLVDIQQVAPTSSICYEIQQQTGSICVTITKPPSLGSRCTHPVWEDLDPYVFPPVAILGKLVVKLCRRIILIAREWPIMLWFWDLVAMSSQIPLYLPDFLTQPFSQTPHRNLFNLNLHAWLQEPQLSKNKAFLRRWQHKLRLHKESQVITQ